LNWQQRIRDFGWLSHSSFVHDLYFRIPFYNCETKINAFDEINSP